MSARSRAAAQGVRATPQVRDSNRVFDPSLRAFRATPEGLHPRIDGRELDDESRGRKARRNREKAQSPAADADFAPVQRFSVNKGSPHKSRRSILADGRGSPKAAILLLHRHMMRQARQAILEYPDRVARRRAYSKADRSAP